MKVLALYLPQYHEIEENNRWWGEKYTEWTAVKNAKPLYSGHKEPRVPLDNYYYDLSDESGSVWRWQAEMANKYGIYGFCIYHYWFCGKQLLEKPMEILRNHPDININYCVCWANETWRKNWYGQEKTVLIEQEYGVESDWVKHYEYLNTFFQDKRYIKIDNKPVINIYHSYEIADLKEMLDVWNKMAKENGFSGVYVVSAITNKGEDIRNELFDAKYMFEPGYTLKEGMKGLDKIKYLSSTFYRRIINKVFGTKRLEHIIDAQTIYKYIESSNLQRDIFPGTFPQWDNTPRTGWMGLSYINTSPGIFKKHIEKLFDKYAEREFLYINAWNEWGEGAYLEPDTDNKYMYLERIKEVQANCNKKTKG